MKIRIATTTDGDSYLVQRIDFKAGTVRTDGEIVSVTTRGSKVTKIVRQRGVWKTFPRSEVSISEVPLTPILAERLLNQGGRNLGRDVEDERERRARKRREAAELLANLYNLRAER